MVQMSVNLHKAASGKKQVIYCRNGSGAAEIYLDFQAQMIQKNQYGNPKNHHRIPKNRT